MSKKSVEQKPSQTAMFTALYRVVANKEFKNKRFGSDYLAEHFYLFILNSLLNLKKLERKQK